MLWQGKILKKSPDPFSQGGSIDEHRVRGDMFLHIYDGLLPGSPEETEIQGCEHKFFI